MHHPTILQIRLKRVLPYSSQVLLVPCLLLFGSSGTMFSDRASPPRAAFCGAGGDAY